MSVTVFNHQHDAALTLDGVGTSGSLLVIQTGTIIFNFQGVSGEGWIRDRLRHPVLDLPASAGTILTTVRAIASAAPASMSFSSPAASITGQQGLFAQGNVGLFGTRTHRGR